MPIAIPIFFVAHWYLSLFSQTFFLHRYSAHGMFTLNRFWERFFFLFTYVTQGSSFLNPRAYAILHRLHHIHSDTEKDPHSPMHHSNIFTMMWKTRKMYLDYLFRKKAVAPEVEAGIPKWTFLENFAETMFSRVFFIALYVAFYIWFAWDQWWWYLLIPVHIIMGPVHGAIVNWFGHKLGYRNYKSDDNSKNTLPADVLLMGELFQNNHHEKPNSPNFGLKWFELDPTFWIMRLLNFLGIIKLKPKRPEGAGLPKPQF